MTTYTWRSQILRTLNSRLGHYIERVVCNMYLIDLRENLCSRDRHLLYSL